MSQPTQTSGRKRRVAPVVFALLFTLLLCGCGGRRGLPANDPRAEKQPDWITIYWMRGAPATALQELGKAYEKESGVGVSVVQLARDTYHDQITWYAKGESVPFDAAVVKAHWMPRFVEDGALMDLSEFLKREVGMTQVHPRLREVLCEYPKTSGEYFAAPLYPDALCLAYRQDWFDDPQMRAEFLQGQGRELAVPTTWEELREVAAFFRATGDNRYGIIMPTGRHFDGLAYMFHQLLLCHGGALEDEESHRVKGYLNSEAALAAVALLRDLTATGPPGAGDADPNDVVTQFVRGSTAMAITFFSTAEGIVSAGSGHAGFAPLPSGPHGKQFVLMEGYGLTVPKGINSKRRDLALGFIKWLMSREGQEEWRRKMGLVADLRILNDPGYRLSRPYLNAYVESLDHAGRFWDLPPYVELMRQIQKYVGDAIDGYIAPAKALDDLTEACAEALRDEGFLHEY